MLIKSLRFFVAFIITAITVVSTLAQSPLSAPDALFVGGEVNKPGKIPFKEGITLKEAISLAEGTTGKAVLGRGVIFRIEEVTGKRHEVKVDLDGIMRGKEQDIVLRPGDVIVVPSKDLRKLFIDSPPIPIKLPIEKSRTIKHFTITSSKY